MGYHRGLTFRTLPVLRSAALAARCFDSTLGDGENVTTHTVETHVYRLRKKLQKDPAHGPLIATERGGYHGVYKSDLVTAWGRGGGSSV